MSKIKKILNILFEKEEKEELNSISKNLNKAEKKEFNTTSKEINTEKLIEGEFAEAQYLTVTEIAKYFKIEASALNNIFSNLEWAYKKDKWWIATDKGIELGAKQEYNTRAKVKYIKWDKKIRDNFELIKMINELKKNKSIKKYTAKEKGDKYEAFIAEHYKKLGYFVWEHGKDKGRLDQGIDLIVKKDKEIIFIQCKNWDKNTRFKIDHVRIKASRAEARQFMLDNPLFKGYKNKFRYTLSNDCMHSSAIKYIEETNGLFDYEIIKMD